MRVRTESCRPTPFLNRADGILHPHGPVEENVFARVPYAAQEQKIYPPFSRDQARRLLDAQNRSRLKALA